MCNRNLAFALLDVSTPMHVCFQCKKESRNLFCLFGLTFAQRKRVACTRVACTQWKWVCNECSTLPLPQEASCLTQEEWDFFGAHLEPEKRDHDEFQNLDSELSQMIAKMKQHSRKTKKARLPPRATKRSDCPEFIVY